MKHSENIHEYIQSLEHNAEIYFRESKFKDAKLIYLELTDLVTNNYLYLARLAYIELTEKKFESAKSLFLKSISLCSTYVEGYNCLGYIFKEQGELDNAKNCYDEALKIDNNYIPALSNLAILIMNKEPKYAEQLLRKAESLQKDNPGINFNLGNVYVILKDYKKAIKYYSNAIRIKPDFHLAMFNLGNVNFELRQFKKASSFYMQAIQLDNQNVDLYSNVGTCHKEMGDFKKATAFYIKALKLNPKHIHTLNNLAVIMLDKQKFDKALSLLREVVKIDSNNPIYLFNLANVFKEKSEFLESLKYLKRAVTLDKYFFKAHAELIHLKGRLCIWDDYLNDLKIASKIGIQGNYPIVHLGMFALHDDPFADLERSRRFYKTYFYGKDNFIESKESKLIRLGYISANFNDHPVIQLLIRTLELHDTSKFDIYFYSLDSSREDTYSNRLKQIDAKFFHIDSLSDYESIKLIRSHNLDLAIDLMGYTKGNNFTLFANRIAPIQISYLGFPGTTGSDCIDYIIADKFLIPNSFKKYYSEKVIYLPLSYQCNDDKLPKINQAYVSKRDNKFKDKFVFVCFNSSYKITPREFSIWMNLLKKVDHSVLWLYESSSTVKANILQIVEKNGIDINRLFFAKALPLDQHLLRHRNADLFLDTFNYSAGATAFISLKACTPIVAYEGNTYTSRMSSSILKSLGLSNLVARDAVQYEEIAHNLATNNQFFQEIKNKLYDLNQNSIFFNSNKFVEDYESLLTQVYLNHY